jgi:hypothetical protein
MVRGSTDADETCTWLARALALALANSSPPWSSPLSAVRVIWVGSEEGGWQRRGNEARNSPRREFCFIYLFFSSLFRS